MAGFKAPGRTRRGRGRLVWLVAAMIVVAGAVVVGVSGWHGRTAAAAWAPSVRQVAGLQEIATAGPAGYSLFTAQGTVGFLPGIDVGATTPGHQPGELAITPGDYVRWLAEIGSLGARAIRIYTIHPPAFYTALASYNNSHPDDPIYLIQGVYLPNDIYLQKQNLYDPVATSTFRQELHDAVAAVNGTLTRPPRHGFASGTWTTDVSRWTAGWIIGVEWDPYATAATDRRNPDAPDVHGRYFSSTPSATPTERWLAARMDDTAADLAATGWTAPIAFANWPTVDPLHHPNEPNPQEDKVGIDAAHVLPTRNWPGGTFASFHIYPYYPDFLQYQPSLQHYQFDGHADPYAAYLHEMLVHFKGVMPVMITEFGVPSSLGSAHNGTLGRSQGDHTEQQAMQMDAQMLIGMRQLGMAGAFVFEWTDEWYKKTWNTELHQVPSGNLELWHDVFTNEQYFGVVATDPLPLAPPVTIYRGGAGAAVRQVSAWEDASYIHLAVTFAGHPAGTATVGLDTIPAGSGPPPPGSTDHRASYALVLDLAGRTGQAWVREALDPDQVDYAPIPPSSRPAPQDGWRTLQLVTDKPWTLPLTGQQTRMQFDNVGLLRYGSWDPSDPGYNNLALWHLNGTELDLRIPWAMAGMSDPSSHQALLPLGEFRASSVTIPGIALTVSADAGPAQQAGTVRWNNWTAVSYTERIKPGASVLRQAFAAVSRPLWARVLEEWDAERDLGTDGRGDMTAPDDLPEPPAREAPLPEVLLPEVLLPEAQPAREAPLPEVLLPEAQPPERLLPEQSREDTDAGWGEYREYSERDDRLQRDRPPHWDDF